VNFSGILLEIYWNFTGILVGFQRYFVRQKQKSPEKNKKIQKKIWDSRRIFNVVVVEPFLDNMCPARGTQKTHKTNKHNVEAFLENVEDQMAKLLKNMSDPTERMLKDIRRATWQSKDYVAENDLLPKPLKTIFKDNAKDLEAQLKKLRRSSRDRKSPKPRTSTDRPPEGFSSMAFACARGEPAAIFDGKVWHTGFYIDTLESRQKKGSTDFMPQRRLVALLPAKCQAGKKTPKLKLRVTDEPRSFAPAIRAEKTPTTTPN
jgi:hypothetical protein